MKFNSSLPLSHFILTFCFYLSLLRGTNMGLFYPASQSELGGLDFTFQIVLTVTLLFALLMYLFFQNNYKFLIKSLSNMFIGILSVGVVISAIFSTDTVQSIKFIVALVSVILPCVLYVSEFGSKKTLELLAVFICITAFLNLIYLIIFPQYAIMTDEHDGAWKGLFPHKNISGSALGAGAAILLSQINFNKKIQSISYLIAALICIAFVIFSKSSTAFISFFIMGVSTVFFHGLLRLKSQKDRLAVILIGISLTSLTYVFLGEALATLFFQIINKDPTLTGRTDIWAVVFEGIVQRPFIGYGPGMSPKFEFMENIRAVVGWEVGSLHNSYLDVLAEYGIPFGIIFIGITLYKLFSAILTVSTTWEIRKNLVLGISLVFSVMIIAMSESSCFFDYSIFFLYFVIGLCIISDMRKAVNTR